MRICFLIKDLRTNGANRVIVNYANELKRIGHNIICYIEYKVFSIAEFTPDCEILDIHSLSLQTENFDLVISTFYSNHRYLSTINAKIKIQFIQDNYFRYGEKFKEREEQIINCLFDKTTKKIVVSKYLRDLYNKLGIKADVIQNGVDTSMFYRDNPYNIQKSNHIVLIEGLLDRPYLNVKKAYSLVPKSYEIWGLSTKPYNLSNVKRMFVNPPQTELKRIYSRADFILELEQNEGFNLVLLEAMACGCVVLTTPCGGHMDYCKHLKNCLIIENDEEVVCFLNQLSDDHKLYRQISKNAIQTSRKYNLDKAYRNLNRLVKKYNSSIH